MSNPKHHSELQAFSLGDATGVTKPELAAEHEGIHVIGILHKQPMAIARVTGMINRCQPDVVAVETQPKVVASYHPDIYDPRWPAEHEIEAAAYAVDHTAGMLIAGIDSEEWEADMETFAKIDAEVFVDMGLIDSPDDRTISTYYKLDREMIRTWRQETQRREPEAFERVINERDQTMAGHLHALKQTETVDTIVAAVGIQHLTGVLDYIQNPERIPTPKKEVPPVYSYHTI